MTYISGYAFYECTSLESVYVSRDITSIDEYAFAFCNSLYDLTLPANLQGINDYSFYACDNLKVVTIEGSYDEWVNVSIYETNYSIIINEDDLDCERIARYVQSEMQKLGASIKIYEDFEKYSDNQEYEIILGYLNINRPEIQKVKSALGSDDFLVTCSGQRWYRR